MERRIGRWVGLAALLAGCAGVPRSGEGTAGAPVGQAAREYQGRSFSVRHSGDLGVPPGSGAAVRGRGGRISGQVCGMDVSYEVSYQGDDVQLTGFLDARFPSEIRVRQEGDARLITGSLGTAAGKAAVDLRLTPGALAGRVGFRRFQLAATGDQLSGELRLAGTDVPTTATISGREALLQLPPGDQGALLPNLLTCYIARVGTFGRSPLVLSIGGPAGAEPRGSSSLYDR